MKRESKKLFFLPGLGGDLNPQEQLVYKMSEIWKKTDVVVWVN